jgi:hypothetical protein
MKDFTGVEDPEANARISRGGPGTGQVLLIGENP